MKRVAELLGQLGKEDPSEWVTVEWSAAYIRDLEATESASKPVRSELDPQVAAVLLLCVRADISSARNKLRDLMRTNLSLIAEQNETYISVLFALFATQQMQLFAAMLADKYGFSGPLEVALEADGPGDHRVRWEISNSGAHRFVFDASALKSDRTRSDVLAFQWEFPVYSNFSLSTEMETGAVIINQGDVGQSPGIAWCENRPNYFLVPDCIFVPTRGYQYAREVTKKNYVAWSDRKSIAFWRGATTGIPNVSGDWCTLERVRLCQIAQSHEQHGNVDVGLSSIIQFSDPTTRDEITRSGLLRGFVPWEDWGQFKYLIDIDGNSSPWSNLFQRFLSGSAVLKVESSRGLNQWYYEALVPWKNYVPIAPDMSDLIEKIEWLKRNDGFAKYVGHQGRRLAEELTYERELRRSVQTIASAFRYFKGEKTTFTPFGWTLSETASE